LTVALFVIPPLMMLVDLLVSSSPPVMFAPPLIVPALVEVSALLTSPAVVVAGSPPGPGVADLARSCIRACKEIARPVCAVGDRPRVGGHIAEIGAIVAGRSAVAERAVGRPVVRESAAVADAAICVEGRACV